MDQQARPKTRLEEKQETLANMVRMVAQCQYHSLFVTSLGGSGKSRTVTNILNEENQEILLLNSHCTPLQLYRILYQASQRDDDPIIFLDDVDSLYQSAPALGILRSALFGQPDRICTYSSSQLPDDLPPKFSTTSRFIFCANQIPKNNPMFDAVLSRCLVYRMDMSNSEIIEQFRVMSANGYPGCPPEAAAELVDFIEEHGADKQLSMRLLTPAVRIYKFCKDQQVDWQPVLLAQLQNLSRPSSPTKRLANAERDERIVREAMRKYPDSTTDACRYYIEKSSKSRASFYRSLKRMKQAQA